MNSDNKPSMEQMIVDTAERLFLDKGFSGTSTTDIAKEVGCNQALIHYYFRTKEKLFNVIFEKKLTVFLEQLLKVHLGDMSFQERIKLMVESHFDLININPKFPRFIVNELLSSPKKLGALKESLGSKPSQLIRFLQEQIDAEAKLGNVRPMKAVDLLLSMLSLNVGIFIFYPLAKEIIDLSESEMSIRIEQRKKENVIMILNSLKPEII